MQRTSLVFFVQYFRAKRDEGQIREFVEKEEN